MWHVSSRSGVATLRTAIHLLLTYLLALPLSREILRPTDWEVIGTRPYNLHHVNRSCQHAATVYVREKQCSLLLIRKNGVLLNDVPVIMASDRQ